MSEVYPGSLFAGPVARRDWELPARRPSVLDVEPGLSPAAERGSPGVDDHTVVDLLTPPKVVVP